MAEIKLNMDSLKTHKKTVRHKIKEGDNIFRFLPPFGPNCNGYPYVYWSIVWGLHDPNSGNQRPYADSKPYEGTSPVWDYLDALRAKIEKMKSDMVSSGMTDEQVKERLKDVNKFVSDLRPKSAYLWNAIDKSGTVGVLELKSTAHKQVLKLMNQYILDYNQDPTSLGSSPADSGVWFNITRTGSNFDTEYSVKKNQVMIKDPNTGVPSYVDDRSPVPESVAADYNNAGYDLTSMYQIKSYSELKTILSFTLDGINNPDIYIEGFVSPKTTAVKPAVNQVVQQAAVAVNQVSSNAMQQAKKTIPAWCDPNDVKDAEVVSDVSTDDLMKMAEDIFNT